MLAIKTQASTRSILQTSQNGQKEGRWKAEETSGRNTSYMQLERLERRCEERRIEERKGKEDSREEGRRAQERREEEEKRGEEDEERGGEGEVISSLSMSLKCISDFFEGW